MTQDEIIEMARSAGMHYSGRCTLTGMESHVERFAKLVAAKEREACASICDGNQYVQPYRDLGNLIRARGKA